MARSIVPNLAVSVVVTFLLFLWTPVSHSLMFSRSISHSFSRRTAAAAFSTKRTFTTPPVSFLVSKFSSSITAMSSTTRSSSGSSSTAVELQEEEHPSLAFRTTSNLSSSSSSSSVLEDLAQRVVTTNKQQTLPLKATFCIAGGGGQAISTLAATEGASSILLEGTIAYDRNSFHQYLGHLDSAETETKIQYVSRQAAAQLSEAALWRGMRFVTNLQSYQGVVGVSCTSSLVSSTSTRANRQSRGHVIATMANGRQWGYDVTLSLPKPSKELQRQRSRIQEDALFSQLVLQTLLDHLEDKGGDSDWVQDCRTTNGDEILKFPSSQNCEKDAVLEGSRRILTQEASVALLVPQKEDDTHSSTFFLLSRPLLPRQTLVFPGSFNPPHQGHLALAQAAVQAMKKQQQDSSTTNDNFSVMFEMSLTNADKPAMDPQVASERLETFFQLEKECDTNIQMPTDWGVLLTSAPLFSEKVDAIQREQYTGESPSSSSSENDSDNKLVFIIGTDTLVRILNPKYYGNSQENMIQAVREMGEKGVRFVAGGRVEQQNPGEKGVFVTGEEDLRKLPQDIQDMFVLIREEDFRVDISSTELRQQQQQQQQQEQEESSN